MEADRQFGEALRGDDRFELPCQQRGAVELADAEPGRVRRGGADRDLVRLVGNGITGAAAERLVAGQSPDQGVSIGQQPQPRLHPPSSSSGKGSSKCASTAILPLNAPNERRPRGSAGTRRTTGTLPRAITTSPNRELSHRHLLANRVRAYGKIPPRPHFAFSYTAPICHHARGSHPATLFEPFNPVSTPGARRCEILSLTSS